MNQTKPIEKDGATSAPRPRKRRRRGIRHFAELGYRKMSEKLGEARMKEYRVEARRRWMRRWLNSERNLARKAFYAFFALFVLFLLFAKMAFNLQVPDAGSKFEFSARPDGPPEDWSTLSDSLSFIFGMPVALAGSFVAIWLAVLAHRAARDTHDLALRQQQLAERQQELAEAEEERRASQEKAEQLISRLLPIVQLAAEDLRDYKDALALLERRLVEMARVALHTSEDGQGPDSETLRTARGKLADAMMKTADALEQMLENVVLSNAIGSIASKELSALTRYEPLFEERREGNIRALEEIQNEYSYGVDQSDYIEQVRKDLWTWGVDSDPHSLAGVIRSAARTTRTTDISETVARSFVGRYNLWIANKVKLYTKTNETNPENDPFTLEKRLPHPQAYGAPDVDFLHLQVKPEAFGAAKKKRAVHHRSKLIRRNRRLRRQTAEIDPNIPVAMAGMSIDDLAVGGPAFPFDYDGPAIGSRADRAKVFTSPELVSSNPEIRELPAHRHLLFAIGLVVDPMGPALPPIVTRDWQYVDPDGQGDTEEAKEIRRRNEEAKKITGVYRDHLYWSEAHLYQDVFGRAPRRKSTGNNEESRTKEAELDESNWEMDDRPSKRELEDATEDGHMLVGRPWHASRIINDIAARRERMSARMNDTISRDKTFFNRGGYILIALTELFPNIEDLVQATFKAHDAYHIDWDNTDTDTSTSKVAQRIRIEWTSRQRSCKPPQGLEQLRQAELDSFSTQPSLFHSIPVRTEKDYSGPRSLAPISSLREELSDELRKSTTATIEESEAV